MFKKLKTVLLLFLICLSMMLTYRLWFGKPALEEGTVPRYEPAYFTEVPPLSEVIQPSKIIFESGDLLSVFSQGTPNNKLLWESAQQIIGLSDIMNSEQIENEEKNSLLLGSFLKITYQFNPSLPPVFISEHLSFLGEGLREIILAWDEEYFRVIICGEKNLYWQLPPGKGLELREKLTSLGGQPHFLLPPTFDLLVCGDSSGEEDPQIYISGQGRTPFQGGGIGGKDPSRVWKIQVPGKIYLPQGDLWASEISLREEEINRDQLVRAFFYDLSMARLIEERDGATYYTNGERGLRIYPFGSVEYTAPSLERVASKISYHVALQKGADNLSLYGGWFPGICLVGAEKMEKGYELSWHVSHEGLILRGPTIGGRMIVNEQGVPFYFRHFCFPGKKISEKKLFCPFEEALYRALSLDRELFEKEEVTLLALEPIYCFGEGLPYKATPAWAIKFAGREEICLHWLTLEPLNCTLTGGEL